MSEDTLWDFPLAAKEGRIIILALRDARQHLLTGGEAWKFNFDLAERLGTREQHN